MGTTGTEELSQQAGKGVTPNDAFWTRGDNRGAEYLIKLTARRELGSQENPLKHRQRETSGAIGLYSGWAHLETEN